VSARELITEHLDLWTGAVTKKSSSGRGSNGKVELTGVKKLRELILELAVRGKLVEQSPDDEPANIILERAQSEKHRLAKKGEIKKPRKLPGLAEMDLPFSVPDSWEWVQLEDISRDWGQKTPDEDFSYIDVASVDNLRGVTTEASVLSSSDAPSRARKVVQQGTLIYSTVRPYLQNIAVIENEITPEPIASTAFAIIHPLASMPARFFLHYLRSPTFVKYVESVQTGIAYPAINDKQFFSGVVPIPPLEEQHRIVQKVDELMALCDRLEQQTSDQLEAHETLVDALLGTLTQSQNATELADNWARLAAHFDTLFTTEQSIDKLKQTILQLAVMGRLVDQDAADEPALDLIHRIKMERLRLQREGKIRAGKKTQPASIEDEGAFLPDSWAACTLGTCINLISGQHLKADEYFGAKKTGSIPYLTGPAEFGELTPAPQRQTFESRAVATKGDILITCKGSGVGKLNTASEDIAISRQLMAAQPILIGAHFLYILLDSLREAIREKTVGIAIPGISREDILDAKVHLPPPEEQHRIVQKVDELMALCDRLNERLNQASETRHQLAEAVVEGALN
jgi:type I restriction enzyme S subunit